MAIFCHHNLIQSSKKVGDLVYIVVGTSTVLVEKWKQYLMCKIPAATIHRDSPLAKSRLFKHKVSAGDGCVGFSDV